MKAELVGSIDKEEAAIVSIDSLPSKGDREGGRAVLEIGTR